MQIISLRNLVSDKILYSVLHDGNASYFEREDEEAFKALSSVCDVSPTAFIRKKDLADLLQDLEIIMKEAQDADDERKYV